MRILTTRKAKPCREDERGKAAKEAAAWEYGGNEQDHGRAGLCGLKNGARRRRAGKNEIAS